MCDRKRPGIEDLFTLLYSMFFFFTCFQPDIIMAGLDVGYTDNYRYTPVVQLCLSHLHYLPCTSRMMTSPGLAQKPGLRELCGGRRKGPNSRILVRTRFLIVGFKHIHLVFPVMLWEDSGHHFPKCPSLGLACVLGKQTSRWWIATTSQLLS